MENMGIVSKEEAEDILDGIVKDYNPSIFTKLGAKPAITKWNDKYTENSNEVRSKLDSPLNKDIIHKLKISITDENLDHYNER